MFLRTALAATLACVWLLPAQAATELTVYSALEVEQLKPYQEAFEAQYPDIHLKWVRDSTGIVTAKLLAEKDRPQADVIWGLAASSLAILEKQGLLQPYAPQNLTRIGARFSNQFNITSVPLDRPRRRSARSTTKEDRTVCLTTS